MKGWSPHVREFKTLGSWIPHRGFQIPGTGFQSLSVELGFLIPLSCENPESCIADSKAQDSGFYKQKFPWFWNPDFFTFGGDDNFSGADPGIFDWGVEGDGVQTLVQKGLVSFFVANYRIYSINHPGRLLNVWTVRVGAYSRWALINFFCL